MKFKFALALVATFFIGQNSFAESFTLTRDDGRTFFCSDNPGTLPTTTYKVNQCDCKYSATGSVVGVALWVGSSTSAAECKAIDSSAKPFGCKTSNLASDKNMLCDCKYSATGSSIGEVLVSETSKSAADQCIDVDSSSNPYNCRVAP